MSDDDILTARDGSLWSFDGIKINGYLEGHAPGVMLASGFLRRKAVLLFQSRKDAEAVDMRKLADEMEAAVLPDCEKNYRDHQKKFPDMVKATPPSPPGTGEGET